MRTFGATGYASGARYYDGYWNKHFVVVAMKLDRGHLTVTVREDDGTTREHSTARHASTVLCSDLTCKGRWGDGGPHGKPRY